MQITDKGVQEQAWRAEERNPLEIVQVTEFWPYWQIVFEQMRICSEEIWDQKFSEILRYKQITQYDWVK